MESTLIRQKRFARRLRWVKILRNLCILLIGPTALSIIGVFRTISHPTYRKEAAIFMLACMVCYAVIQLVAYLLALWRLDTSQDLWAIGPLLEASEWLGRQNFFKPLGQLLSHVDTADCLNLSVCQQEILHKFVSDYYIAFGWPPARMDNRRKILEGALRIIDWQDDTTAIPALKQFIARASKEDREKYRPLLERLTELAAQQSVPATLVRAAEAPNSELLHPAQPSEDKHPADNLIRPSQP